MTITTTNFDNKTTISLDEKFDFDSVENFRDAYTQATAKEYTVDFRSTEYMDSSGLGMLLNMKRYLNERNITKITLTNCRPQIKKILTISRFETKFIIT